MHRGKSMSGPWEPSRSSALVGETKFTNGADKGRVVLPKSKRTFSAVTEKADVQSLAGMGFGDEQALQVLDMARWHYAALRAWACPTTVASRSPWTAGPGSSRQAVTTVPTRT